MSTAPLAFERRRSAVHGDGVFTLGPIPAGRAVFEFGGPVVTGAQVREGMRVMQIGPDAYIVEDIEADHIENYVNHRCEPNLGFTGGDLTLHSLRPIAAGEELFWDYSTSINDPGWALPCSCGVPACRGSIQSYRDLPEHHRARLRGIALSYLR
jgi:hypothetical protein